MGTLQLIGASGGRNSTQGLIDPKALQDHINSWNPSPIQLAANRQKQVQLQQDKNKKSSKPQGNQLLNALGSVGKGVLDFGKQAIVDPAAGALNAASYGVAHGIADVTGLNKQIDKNQASINASNQAIAKQAFQRANNTSLPQAVRDKARQVANNALDQSINSGNQQVKQLKSQANVVDPAKFAANTLLTGANLFTGGEGGALLQGGKALAQGGLKIAAAGGAKQLIKRGVVRAGEGAVAGAAYGGAGAISQGGVNTTGKDIRQGALTGAAIGAGLGVAAPIIGKGLTAAGSKVKSIFTKGADAHLAEVKAAPPLPALSDQEARNLTPQKVPVAGGTTADKINVRTPVTMSAKDYTQKFNDLSNHYDKAQKELEQLPSLRQKAMAQIIEDQHTRALSALDEAYHNPQLSPKVSPTPINPTTGVKLSSIPANRPAADIQKQIEQAHNSGDNATVQKLIPQLPKEYQDSTKSALGLPTSAPAGPVLGQKVAGSALAAEQRAVTSNLTKEFEGKATYSAGSYKDEAAKAVQLAHDNPQKALDIATGKTPGDNAIHEVAVARALETKAQKEGDIATLQKLASSPRHTATSEAAQRLGSEAYNAVHNSPTEHIRQVNEARAQSFEKKSSKPIAEITKQDTKAIKAATPKVNKDDWQAFVNELRC